MGFLMTTASAQTRSKYEFKRNLPVYADSLIADFSFPLAWGNSPVTDFSEWRQAARQKVFDCMLMPPPAPADGYSAKVLFEEQRDGYRARKIEIRLSRYYTVPAYLLIPDGKGPFPAVNLLHDHGAHLFIGKEKMIRPLACEDSVVVRDADDWLKGYEGQFFGDYLARNGYVVFSADAPMWGERGQMEGPRRDRYDIIAGNMMMYGIDLSAWMTYDDIAATDYLATLPEVDASRIGCAGWSMGAYRAWMLAALSDRIKAGAAVCWMVTTDEQLSFKYDRTENGGFANCLPGLRRWLDYPHIASIACPKPMLFINGSQDKLFPEAGARKAFDILHATWDSQGAAPLLETELWPMPHACNKQSQRRVLEFLNKHLTTADAQTLPYQDAALTAARRADDLLSRLTLDEKISLMMDTSPAIERLGIPQFQWWNEALHGVGRNGFATVFPITMAMAASWDDALLHQVFTAVSDEARVKARQAKRAGDIKRYQSLSFWTPNINIFRDPRWGRGQETYGEDPYLTAKMGLAVVRGLQGVGYHGEDLGISKYRKLLACAKHFAVHSGPEWNRHEFNVENLPERDLWETYLPAFKSLVQEGKVAEIMCAYQRIDGQPCCSQTRYEQQILRDEWGFDGLITSDCGAIRDFLPRWHNTAKDPAQASAQAVLAGTDVECGSEYKHLPEAVRRGDISEADLDRSLRRLLIARFELGDLDPDERNPWTQIPESVVACDAHKQLALDMARKSIVLLQNRNGVLPLDKSQPVVVMGANAVDSVMQWGNYSGFATRTVTALEGIQAVNPQARYISGCGLTRNEVFESRFGSLTSPSGNKGMTATYYNTTEPTGTPAATVNLSSPIMLSNGGNTVFAPGVNLEHFSARLEGTFVPENDETVIFNINCDDKVRLIVEGDTLVNIWKVRNRIQGAQPEMDVKAGKPYRVQIDYVQESDFAFLGFDIQHKVAPTHQQLLAQIGAAETVVFVGGISPKLEGEEMLVNEEGFKGGDRTSIELPKAQRETLRMLHEAGKRVVFVNCSGSAMALTPELESCDAILQAWYGGESGGQALAEVLYGDYNPSGKLPVTFYRTTDDLPDFLDYTMKGRTYRYFKGTPLFPFGFGLSYTQFEIGTPVYADGQVRLSVKNTGSRAGLETVQVYIRNLADADGPLKTLRAYQQVSLAPGESKTISILLPRERFEGWDAATNTMRVIPGRYELMVGNSSSDTALQKLTVDIK